MSRCPGKRCYIPVLVGRRRIVFDSERLCASAHSASQEQKISDVDIHFSQVVGQAIVDTGFARCVGGETAVNAHIEDLRAMRYRVYETKSDIKLPFGNGSTNLALSKVQIPVRIGER